MAARLRRRLAEADKRFQGASQTTPPVPDEPWRDRRLWDTALGVLAGTLSVGDFAADLPSELRAESAARVRDVIGAAVLVNDTDSIEIRRAKAWVIGTRSEP